MSYILDALKKADAQRERDPARGIHAQPGSVPAANRPGAGDRSWFWGASALAAVGIAAAGWAMYQDRAAVETPVRARTESAVRPAATVAAPSEAPAAVAAATPVTDTAAPPAPPVASVVLPPPAAPRVEPGAGARNSSPPAPRAGPPSAPGAPAAAPPAATSAAVPAAAAPAPAVAAPAAAAGNKAATDSPKAATPALAARAGVPALPPIISGPLPPDAPKLAFSGAVYSSNPAQRMLIVNGQVVHEGADLGAGVVLEEIKPKAAVVRFRGGRYNVGL